MNPLSCLYRHETQFIKENLIIYKHTLISFFNNICRYLDHILAVDNPNFLIFVKHIKLSLTVPTTRVRYLIWTSIPFSCICFQTCLRHAFFFLCRQFSFLSGRDIPLDPCRFSFKLFKGHQVVLHGFLLWGHVFELSLTAENLVQEETPSRTDWSYHAASVVVLYCFEHYIVWYLITPLLSSKFSLCQLTIRWK